MKAMLVMDMPDCCYDCEFCRFNGGYVHGYYGRDCLLTGEDVQNNNFDIITSRHKTCPLKPIPKYYPSTSNPQRIEYLKQLGMTEKEQYYYELGHDDCIDEILREQK